MLRRSFCCAFILALSALLGRPAAAAAQGMPSIPVTAQSGWKVEIRRAGEPVWMPRSKYVREAEARSAAASLYREGYQVRITKYTSLTFRRPTTAPDRDSFRPDPVPPSPSAHYPAPIPWPQAREVFAQMQAMGDRIAFRFPTDGCYARAHLMAQQMRKFGLQPWKVWSKANGKEPLFAKTKNHPRGYVIWGWHVAPVLRVTLNSGKEIWCVFDPSLWTRPCSIAEWLKVQTRSGATVKPRYEVTVPGKAPLWEGKRIGSGYTVANTIPVDRLDEVAWARMREYKPYEGKWHPKLDKDAPEWAKRSIARGTGSKPGSTLPKFGMLDRRSGTGKATGSLTFADLMAEGANRP
jgi:hypothetical protein